MYFVKHIVLFLFFSAIQAAELAHYGSLVVPYDGAKYEMRKWELKHDAYASYDLKAEFPELKVRNTESTGNLRFNIGFFNEIKYDSIGDWGNSVVGGIRGNQKLGNFLEIFDQGQLGDSVQYYGIANGSKNPNGKIDMTHIEYKIGYVTFGRMMAMQVFLIGDESNRQLTDAFYREMNSLLSAITDGGVLICNKKIPDNGAWKKVKWTR